MLNNLKALIVILPIALAVFIAAKPICLRFMAEKDFIRRRNVWLALTSIAFLIPNFWIFVAIAIPLLVWSGRRDNNVIALYMLLLLALPPRGQDIPVVVINQLFQLGYYRILALTILVPAAWLLLTTRSSERHPAPASHVLLLSYAVLHLALLVPYETITNTMRRSFLFTIDAVVVYYVASRVCTTRAAIVEAMACFCLSCAIAAPIAVFESSKGWLLYVGLSDAWDSTIAFAYTFRSEALRAQVSAGHSLTLGYLLAMGFGFCMYLRSRTQSVLVGLVMLAWAWAGLIAAYSRAPWFVAVLAFFTFLTFGPNAFRRFSVSVVAATVLAGAILASPLGARIIDRLPFIGTIDEANVTYRQHLAAVAWELIKMSPFFGTPNVMLYLESLRQGQGIIDLVNCYATIAMYYGITGLALFLGFFVCPMISAYKVARKTTDVDTAYLGGSLVACMMGTLFMMATGGFGTGLAIMFWLLPGMAVGYAGLSTAAERTPAVNAPGLGRMARG